MISGLKLTKRPQALLLDAGDTLLFFDAAAVAAELGALGVSVEPALLAGALHDAKRAYQARLATGHRHEDGWNVLMSELLTLSGVAVGAASLLWRHPLAFIAFASLGGGLVATGILIYLWAIAAPARP